MAEEKDSIELGGNIELAGFRDLEPGKLVVVKKIVGSYARKMSDASDNFESLKVTMKHVNESKHEIHAKLTDNKKPTTAEVTDFNLFFALDKALNKVLTSISK